MRIGQWLCGMARGHEFIRQVTDTGQQVVCMHCGWESAGWENAPPAYAQTQPRDVARLTLHPNPKVVLLARKPRRRHGAVARG